MLFFQATIFLNMFAVGINESFEDLTSLSGEPAKLLRSLFAVVVLVPAVVFALLWFLDLPGPVASGMAILAAAAGAPMTTKRSAMAGAKLRYVSSLQLSLGVAAVIVTPITLAIFYAAFDLTIESVSPLEVARQVAIVQLLPVSLALIAGRVFPAFTEAAAKPVAILGTVMLLVLVVVGIVPGVRLLLTVGTPGLGTIFVVAILALAIGHVLGGPDHRERAGLAVACIARNIGLALFIVALGDTPQEVIPTVAAFLLVGFAVAIPYSAWAVKKSKQTAAVDS